jgi:hypothetical protein
LRECRGNRPLRVSLIHLSQTACLTETKPTLSAPSRPASPRRSSAHHQLATTTPLAGRHRAIRTA